MTTHSTPRFRLWIELAVLALTAFLALLTLVDPTWIEHLTGIDPDRGSGTLEAAIVVGLVIVSVLSAVVSWRELRRPVRLAGRGA